VSECITSDVALSSLPQSGLSTAADWAVHKKWKLLKKGLLISKYESFYFQMMGRKLLVPFRTTKDLISSVCHSDSFTPDTFINFANLFPQI